MTVERQTTGAPPIRQSVLVRSNAEHTFTVFIRDIGLWWPTRPFSMGTRPVRQVVFQQRLGGRVYEVADDGTETTWGEVLCWEPPHRFRMTWEAFPAVTEVEVRFKPLGPALTRVEVEHGGWDRLTPDEVAECANAGDVSGGWQIILAAFAAAVADSGSDGSGGAA
jgi:uncharacterized protein YndB with AHSA1/START domain